MTKTIMPDGKVYVLYEELREQALMYANSHGEPDTMTIARAEAYLAFLKGENEQQEGGDRHLHAGN